MMQQSRHLMSRSGMTTAVVTAAVLATVHVCSVQASMGGMGAGGSSAPSGGGGMGMGGGGSSGGGGDGGMGMGMGMGMGGTRRERVRGTYLEADIQYEAGQSGPEHEHFIEIDGDFGHTYRFTGTGSVPPLESGSDIIEVSSAILNDESEEIFITENDTVARVGRRHSRSRRQQHTGTKKVLVIRGIAPDAQTTATKAQLSNYVFGTSGDPVNLRSQYQACSYNTLNFEPHSCTHNTNCSDIVDGVGEVTININVTGTANSAIRNAMRDAAKVKWGGDRAGGTADYVMLCLPPGTQSGWIAYAYVNHWLSVYNNQWCNYLSGQMHELGHNLNLAHSGETSTYDDQTGMMGFSYSQNDGPIMCFNTAKSAQMGWYDTKRYDYQQGQTVQLDLVGPTELQATGTNYIVVKIPGSELQLTKDYFVGFNRQVGFNSGTREAGNRVVVHEKNANSVDNRYAVSVLKAKLAAGGSYTIMNAAGGHVRIRVDSLTTATQPNGGPQGFATVTIEPFTYAPTASPTESPTGITPTPSPTLSPTASPVPYTPCTAGRIVGGRGETPTDAGADTRHEVTCCSDVAVSGWDACHDGSVWAERNGNLFNDAKVALGYTTSTGGLYVGVGNPNTAGGALQWRTDGCVDNANWAIANSVCSAIVVDSVTDRRARLCTVAELTGGSAGSCGTGTGCNHDSDMVWSNEPASNVSSSYCDTPVSQPPTLAPTASPTISPTTSPTMSPTTTSPSVSPTVSTASPTVSPTVSPSVSPTASTASPTVSPTTSPSVSPTVSTASPTLSPTVSPSVSPTVSTASPTVSPTVSPSVSPTVSTASPTVSPTVSPSVSPTVSTASPTVSPTVSPSVSPTVSTASPTVSPTVSPSVSPTVSTASPTVSPTVSPSVSPTVSTASPTVSPTVSPSVSPTVSTASPTVSPTVSPSVSPTVSTASPTVSPTVSPSVSPTASTASPTVSPTSSPSVSPTVSTASPTLSPTMSPSIAPTASPAVATTCTAGQIVGGRGETPRDAGADTRHEVTCCSDVAVSGWDACHDGSVWAERNGNLFNDAKVALGYTTLPMALYVGEGNPNTAGGAMQWRTDGCVDNANWAIANSVCSAIVVDSTTDRRARLCTVAELTGGSAGSCGTGTGCNHDSDMVWSANPATNVSSNCNIDTPQPTPPPTRAPTVAPTPSSQALPTCTSGRIVHGRASGTPLDAGGTTRHEVACCTNTAVPGWTPCMAGGRAVWAERNGPEFQAAKVALGYSMALAGTYTGVGDPNVGGGALQWRADGCVDNAEWQVAADVCHAIVVDAATDERARLCTEEELESQCARGTGCSHDVDLLWSSSAASNESVACAAPEPNEPAAVPTCNAADASCPVCSSGKIVDGSGGTTVQNAGATTRHEVTCCASQAVSGWTACAGGTAWAERDGALFQAAKVALGYSTSLTGTYQGTGNPSEAGGAFQWRSDGCVDNAEWALAEEICHAIVVDSSTGARARLCTDVELQQECGRNLGCAHNSDMIWSSSPGSNITAECGSPNSTTAGSRLRRGQATASGRHMGSTDTVVSNSRTAIVAAVAAVGLVVALALMTQRRVRTVAIHHGVKVDNCWDKTMGPLKVAVVRP